MLQSALGLVKQLQEAMQLGQLDVAQTLVLPLKITLLQFPTAVDADVKFKQDLMTRESLELFALLAAQRVDPDAFERNLLLLKPFFFQSSALPPSERQYPILGLHLLCLLAHNRIAEFHTELEWIPIEASDNPYVRFVRELEQFYMEGSYSKVLQANAHIPASYYSTFMSILATTVRVKIGDCCEKAYKSLSVADISSLFALENENQLHELCSKRSWNIEKDRVTFGSESRHLREIPSQQLINDMLSYANELERIV